MLTISWPFGSTSIGGENGGCEVCPFPFWEPVSATPTIALEFPHAAAALWANQIDDRRNEAGIAFAVRHGSSPILLWSNAIRSAPCKPKANSQASREGLGKTAIPSCYTVDRVEPATNIWHVTEHPRPPLESISSLL